MVDDAEQGSSQYGGSTTRNTGIWKGIEEQVWVHINFITQPTSRVKSASMRQQSTAMGNWIETLTWPENLKTRGDLQVIEAVSLTDPCLPTTAHNTKLTRPNNVLYLYIIYVYIQLAPNQFSTRLTTEKWMKRESFCDTYTYTQCCIAETFALISIFSC